MTDQELFEKLKREGECWHDLVSIIPFNSKEPYFHKCRKCGFLTDDCQEECNPQFLTPDGFFWLWDRVWEKRMFEDFIMECEISELDPHMSPEMAFPILFKHIVHPTRFTEALKQYLKGKRR